MTTLDTRPTAMGIDAPSTYRALRIGLAIIAPFGVLAIGVGKLVMPYGFEDDAATVLSKVAADPGAMEVLGWLRLVICIALVPGILAAGLAALRGAPRLATVALLIAVPTWSCALAFPDTDSLASALVATGVPTPNAVELYDYMVTFSGASASVAVLLFVVGHIVGTVLLGIALWRSRAVPAWIGIALAVSQPLHFIAFAVLQSVALDVVAYSLTTLGVAAAGIAYARQR